jgi:hypothetical protein
MVVACRTGRSPTTSPSAALTERLSAHCASCRAAACAPRSYAAGAYCHDHVRLYGLDVTDRLTAAGFDVERVVPAVEYGSDIAARYGLLDTDDVLICRKPR